MARTPLVVITVPVNQITGYPVYVPIDAENGMEIPAGYKSDTIRIHVKHASQENKTLTVRKGNNPPAMRAAIGDLVLPLDANSEQMIGGLESARFQQIDGTTHLDFESGTIGLISAYHMR